MKNRRFTDSFRNAATGVQEAVQSERNMRIHLSVLGIVVLAGLVLRLDPLRWALVLGASGLVVSVELLNTALEYLTDMVSPHHCEEARRVKDMAAGAVLVAALAAAGMGAFAFLEPGLRWFGLLP